MKELDKRIREMLSEEDKLPECVLQKKEEAYRRIRANALPPKKKRQVRGTFRAAGWLIACLIVFGSATVAAAAVLGRYERMKNMDRKEKNQILKEQQKEGNLTFTTSREMTEEEKDRMWQLRKSYKADEIFPLHQLRRIKESREYTGDSICLIIGEDQEELLLFLPEHELTDEELLEMIEYEEKGNYVLYEERHRSSAVRDNWESRLEEMTDEEADFYYLAYWSGNAAVSGAFVRGNRDELRGDSVLSAQEEALYRRMQREYEEENRIPVRTDPVAVIEYPEEYDGTQIAFCRWNACFYLPESALTEEDFLEIIDFRKRAEYSAHLIEEELAVGKRNERPVWNREFSKENGAYEDKEFSKIQGAGKVVSVDRAKIGDVVILGSYEQNADTADGPEKIEWCVIDADQNSLTLLSVDVLDAGIFDARGNEIVPWESCDLRGWLNGVFYDTAFSGEEKKIILETKLENDYGNATQDLVWLLSETEYLEYFGLDPEECRKMQEYRNNRLGAIEYYEWWLGRIRANPYIAAKASGMLEQKGIYIVSPEVLSVPSRMYEIDLDILLGCTGWWLRSSGPEYGYEAGTADVWSPAGSSSKTDSPAGIRPVIRIRK
ncbi:MAG: hypothetical protein J6Z35_10635 [Lachnospiraceae bacterium]|nr:hypothetical protein [Lachnospiraceae bacterium]